MHFFQILLKFRSSFHSHFNSCFSKKKKKEKKYEIHYKCRDGIEWKSLSVCASSAKSKNRSWSHWSLLAHKAENVKKTSERSLTRCEREEDKAYAGVRSASRLTHLGKKLRESRDCGQRDKGNRKKYYMRSRVCGSLFLDAKNCASEISEMRKP